MDSNIRNKIKPMKRTLLTLILSAIVVSLYAQISYGGEPFSFKTQLSKNIDYRVMSEIDVEMLLAEDAEDENMAMLPGGLVKILRWISIFPIQAPGKHWNPVTESGDWKLHPMVPYP
jgi:hypothetical protein